MPKTLEQVQLASTWDADPEHPQHSDLGGSNENWQMRLGHIDELGYVHVRSGHQADGSLTVSFDEYNEFAPMQQLHLLPSVRFSAPDYGNGRKGYNLDNDNQVKEAILAAAEQVQEIDLEQLGTSLYIDGKL